MSNKVIAYVEVRHNETVEKKKFPPYNLSIDRVCVGVMMPWIGRVMYAIDTEWHTVHVQTPRIRGVNMKSRIVQRVLEVFHKGFLISTSMNILVVGHALSGDVKGISGPTTVSTGWGWLDKRLRGMDAYGYSLSARRENKSREELLGAKCV